MKVAGLGFQREANIDSLREALVAAGGARGLRASKPLATSSRSMAAKRDVRQRRI